MTKHPTIFLHRLVYLKDRTLGTLEVRDGSTLIESFASLELPWRNNEDRISCFPSGTYTAKRRFSPSRKVWLFELEEVPGRDHCQIHVANFPEQLRGCVAIGADHADINKDGLFDVASSGKGFKRFMELLKGHASVTIVVTGDGRDRLRPGMNGWK